MGGVQLCSWPPVLLPETLYIRFFYYVNRIGGQSCKMCVMSRLLMYAYHRGFSSRGFHCESPAALRVSWKRHWQGPFLFLLFFPLFEHMLRAGSKSRQSDRQKKEIKCRNDRFPCYINAKNVRQALGRTK